MSDTHTATVDATAFYRAVLNASLFACTDDTLPSLCAVHFTSTEPGRLLLEATNRYVISREDLDLIDPAQIAVPGTADPPPVPETDLDILVVVTGLVKITKMLASLQEFSPLAGPPRIVIEWVEGEGHAAFTLTGQACEPDQTLRAEVLTSGEFPRAGETLFGGHRKPRAKQPSMAEIPAGEPPAEFILGQKWLTLFGKVESDEVFSGKKRKSDRHVSVEFSAGLPGAAVLVKIGSRFRAMVVPIRKIT
jgi:hypothetical protein